MRDSRGSGAGSWPHIRTVADRSVSSSRCGHNPFLVRFLPGRETMWADNDTDRDFLNFTGVADTVAEIIVQAGGKPISIGVSVARGVGESSMIRLIRPVLPGRAEGRADGVL